MAKKDREREQTSIDAPDVFLLCPVGLVTLEGRKVLPHKVRPVILCKNGRTLTAFCYLHGSRAFSSDNRMVRKFMEAANGSNGKASARVR